MIILDIEASGLSEESYPIQLALLDSDTGDSLMFYIKPAEDWIHWDETAQDIHNITKHLLDNVGIDVDDAVKRIIEFMTDKGENTMYCDAPNYDGFWLSRLFDAAYPVEVHYRVDHVISICDSKEEADQILDIMSKQDRPHDALEDCELIWDAVKEVMYP
jgi:hypothetical protein